MPHCLICRSFADDLRAVSALYITSWVYDLKPVCTIHCFRGSKAGCVKPADIARRPCTGETVTAAVPFCAMLQTLYDRRMSSGS